MLSAVRCLALFPVPIHFHPAAAELGTLPSASSISQPGIAAPVAVVAVVAAVAAVAATTAHAEELAAVPDYTALAHHNTVSDSRSSSQKMAGCQHVLEGHIPTVASHRSCCCNHWYWTCRVLLRRAAEDWLGIFALFDR